jgi:DNA-binding IclR family transcriptional regulator
VNLITYNSDVQNSLPGNDKSIPQYPIASVDNALRLILLLGEHSEIRLTEASEYLGVASSTAHRLLAMLQYRGFVRQDPRTKVYQSGAALTNVAF